MQRFDKACGESLGNYGLAGWEELSSRRAKAIPVRSTIYDLFNFASEASTHQFKGRNARNRLNAWIGETLQGEYDLEDSVSTFPEYRDYFLARPGAESSAGQPPA